MTELVRLHRDHAPALLAFEQENRDYFAASVPDRGDAYFADFEARHESLLAEQAAGTCHFHVLVDIAGAIVGRVNLVDVAGGAAELGFRIAKCAAGRGLATTAVRQMCGVAAAEYGLAMLRAATTLENAGSRAVLARNGFTKEGETVLAGRPALRFSRSLGLSRSPS
ncbi:GNAT family N-acetyltransferase [Streptomyces sp. PT12]|uniref:GNAT family N-acetyltransferase n=1 Tax=Streptomyces sp. PT12 TaxID=1510197 RepID=UPI000DE2C8DF|nr:GNAT family N-acetyltransferase [Streptomyces sp. PT12]RBM23302.1 GNAT family N-acetyltransferase [Streptomyces sp. PT12]